MDTTHSTGRVAQRLGTTRSRVHRAVTQGVVRPDRTTGGHLRFEPHDVSRLEQHLGFAPEVAGLSREEVLVASALLGRPLGLRSARAVARVARISPTTAGRSLRRLEKLSLVRRTCRRVVLGKATDVEVWEADVRNRRWAELAPLLAATVFPQAADSGGGDVRVPRRLRHLFWNVDVAQLDVRRDASYIAGRILASDDAAAHAWAATELPADAFISAARMRGVPAPRARLARNLAHWTLDGDRPS